MTSELAFVLEEVLRNWRSFRHVVPQYVLRWLLDPGHFEQQVMLSFLCLFPWQGFDCWYGSCLVYASRAYRMVIEQGVQRLAMTLRVQENQGV